MNLDFAKVCGKHSAIYEAYYKQIDPKGSGAIEAMTAAKFLKKSGLSDVVLSRVWDLSDPNGKGFLDKPGFFVALKLVSLAQAGQVINLSHIYTDTTNPPKVGDLPKIMPPRPLQNAPMGAHAPAVAAAAAAGAHHADWSIGVIDRLKYEQLFETLKPVGGMLPGNKVKNVLMDSKLPMETLGKIWDLADQDKDGNLDKHEFIVAMHLVYQTLEKRVVPDVLPPELRKAGGSHGPGPAHPPPPKPAPPAVVAAMPRAPSGEGFGDAGGGFVANFPKDIAPPPAIPPLPVAMPPMQRIPPVGSAISQAPLLISTDPLISIGAPPSVTAAADWVVVPSELKRYEVMFRDSDRDKDGLVSGLEVKNVFLQSGVPQNCLAHIWALCDTNQSGKLTLEQFALAMWMVERKQKGIEPPQVLTANMVPPSMRSTVSGVDVQQQAEPKPAYSNPELEMISKEIEELAKERRALETEIAQKEADIRIKSGEVRSLQSELDTLSATLKQLENQRGEAQKRLDDLKAQSTEFVELLASMKLELSQIRNKVNKIRDQCQKQEETINEQEGELNAKRSELQKLKDEEAALQKEYDENNSELQKLTQHLQNTQLQISSVRSMVTQLMETQRQMTDALLMCRAAIESQDAELVSEYQLKIEPDFDDARKTLEKKIEEPKHVDPFEDNNSSNAIAPKTSNGFARNGFGMSNSSADPFAAAAPTIRGGFDDSFNSSSGFDSGFDAFGSGGGGGGGGNAFGQQKDPFGASDAFGVANKPSGAVTPEPGKDDFGSDPFAALHAPTGQGQVLSPNAQNRGPPPRPESPSPALPPKKSKVPPPRPAPPRPLQGPPRPTQPAMDAFGAPSAFSGGGGSGGAFADFADFDNKLPSIPLPLHHHNNNNNTNIITTTTTTPLGATITAASLFDTDVLPASFTTNIHDDAINTAASAAATTTTNAFSLNAFTASFNSTNVTTTTTNNNNNNNTTITTTASTITTNNHLTDSHTPLQQAASGAGAGGGSNNNSAKPSAGVISGPTDFSDDPFKDYRYEDPFNIKDPFADDEEDLAKAFGNELSSDADSDDNESEENKSTNTNSRNATINSTRTTASSSSIGSRVSGTTTANTSQSFSTAKSHTPLASEFLDHFDLFNLTAPPTPSPVLSQSFASSTASSGAAAAGSNSNSSKSQSHTPVPQITTTSALFDDFADFDAFSTKSNSTVDSLNVGVGSSVASSSLNNTNNNNSVTAPAASVATAAVSPQDTFFDAFNDNFETNSISNTKVKSTTVLPKKTNSNIFDAFNDMTLSNTQLDAFGGVGGGGGGVVSAFDAFAVNSNNNAANSFSNAVVATAAVTKSSKLFDDFNDDAFGDSFFKNTAAATTAKDSNNLNFNNINNNFNSDSSKFGANIDAGAAVAATNDNFASFDAFGDNSVVSSGPIAAAFESDFGATLNNSVNLTSTTADSSVAGQKLTKVQNLTSNLLLAKTSNQAAQSVEGVAAGLAAKQPERYAADYSKPETFDDDLQEALKRSMMDK